MSLARLNILRLPRVSPLLMLHLEEAFLRYDVGKENYQLLNHPLPHHKSVILGLSGRVSELVNTAHTKRDKIPLIKRYTGGGTVFVNEHVRFTGMVLNKEDIACKPYPHDVMEWTEDSYKQTFSNPIMHTPVSFELRENDYVVGNLKIAGNAQSFIRTRLTHHTSFLWELDHVCMEEYLSMPSKRPEYRAGRSHTDFLTPIRPFFFPASQVDEEGQELSADPDRVGQDAEYQKQFGTTPTLQPQDLQTYLREYQHQYDMLRLTNTTSPPPSVFEDGLVAALRTKFDIQELGLNDIQVRLEQQVGSPLNTVIMD